MKTHAKKERRLRFAAIVALAGVAIVLIAGMILIQEEITNSRGTVAGIVVFFAVIVLVTYGINLREACKPCNNQRDRQSTFKICASNSRFVGNVESF